MKGEDQISIITSKKEFLNLNFKELFQYKDLLFLFVKRDFISVYKQTILGPLWFFIQPVFTTLIFTVVFGRFAGLSTDGAPQFLFYLSGITCWNYFSDSLIKTSNTFIENQNIFGKVYFPRIITPLSIVISSLIKFGIQFLLFVFFYLYYVFFTDSKIEINAYVLLFPYILLLMAVLGLGLGMIISSLTTKYRDLRFLIQFGVQLWMYATPIIYPLSSLDGNHKTIALINPMTSIIETFKYGFMGHGTFEWLYLIYSSLIAFMLLVIGLIIFSRTEKNFMDII